MTGTYHAFTRVGMFKPVAMPGGTQAIKEPWRNTYAHLMAEMGWNAFAMNYGELDLFRYLDQKPRAVLDRMVAQGVNSPVASSCGRLCDAVAAAVGLCRDRVMFEGQAAMLLEQCVDQEIWLHENDALAYPFTIPNLPGSSMPYIEPLSMWQALLGDLVLGASVPVIAARFHKGLAKSIVAMVKKCAAPSDDQQAVRTVVLSGGVFQNRLVFEAVNSALIREGYRVLAHRRVPMNDGGLALGQAVVAAARTLSSC